MELTCKLSGEINVGLASVSRLFCGGAFLAQPMVNAAALKISLIQISTKDCLLWAFILRRYHAGESHRGD